MEKAIKLIFRVVVVVLAGISIYFLFINVALTMEIAGLGRKNEKELAYKSAQEREVMRRELEGKYREDLISFEAKYKQLDIIKKRSKDLEKKSLELRQKK